MCTIGEQERRLPKKYGEITSLSGEEVRIAPILGGKENSTWVQLQFAKGKCKRQRQG